MTSATRKPLLLMAPLAAVLLVLGATAMTSAAPPPKIQVTAAVPDQAAQGTSGLVVQVKGKNFAPGASVRFLESGSNREGGIAVVDVTFVDSETLETTVDVDAVATVGSFDIEVQLQGSGKGKGTELFAVTSNGGGPTTDAMRVTFRDAPGDRLSSDDGGNYNPALLCADGVTPLAQYWNANQDLVDILCQGSAADARMHADLTSGRGLLLRTHQKGGFALPGPLPPGNRWLTIDFSVGNDGTIAANCPDLDTVWYSDPIAEIASMYPDIVPGCVDNVEMQFPAGNDILDLPLGALVGTAGDWSTGPQGQIRMPTVLHKNKKQRSFQVRPEYSLVWDTLVVTAAGDGDSVTLACGDELGHDCVARLEQGGVVGGPGSSDPVLIGFYDIPFEITVQRVECDASGLCAVP